MLQAVRFLFLLIQVHRTLNRISFKVYFYQYTIVMAISFSNTYQMYSLSNLLQVLLHLIRLLHYCLVYFPNL